MPRNDGKVIKLKLCQEDYIKLKGESLIRGRTMAYILREALDLYFGECAERISYQKFREMGKEKELPVVERKPFNPADNIQVTMYGPPAWTPHCGDYFNNYVLTTSSSSSGGGNEWKS